MLKFESTFQYALRQAQKHHDDLKTNCNVAFHYHRIDKLLDQLQADPPNAECETLLQEAKMCLNEMRRIGRRQGKSYYLQMTDILQACLLKSATPHQRQNAEIEAFINGGGKVDILSPEEAKKVFRKASFEDDSLT